MRRVGLAIGSLAILGLCATEARASSVTLFETVFNTDYVSSAIGLNGLAGGPITVTGVSGPITQAVLFWRGPKSIGDPNVNANITLDGAPVTGTDLGDPDGSASGGSSGSGGLGYLGGSSPLGGQAYGANVTGLVTGNGTYTLGGLLSGGAGIDGGARLFVFFDDGSGDNNHDVVLSFPTVFDPAGWGTDPAGWGTDPAGWGTPGGSSLTGGPTGDSGSDGTGSFTTDAVTPTVDAVPEPTTLLLIGSGLALARRSRRSS